jgi:hypothetical protein
MIATGRVFLDFSLPNATTWFYFSALLAVGFFFKFTRFFSIRNLDVVSLYLLVPGLLLLLENQANWYGFLWLISVSCYYFCRCLWDLALVRRPALSANLNLPGLVWLAGAFFVSLIAVAAGRPASDSEPGRAETEPVKQAQLQAEHVTEKVASQIAGPESDNLDIRFLVGRCLTVLCHLAIVVGLIVIGLKHFQDLHAGIAAANFYLLLPYSYLLLPFNTLQVGQWYHVWPMALIIWAIVSYRKPTVAGILMGLATGTVYFPVFSLPVWFSFYGRRGAGRFGVACALAVLVCLMIVAFLWWSEGPWPRSIYSALSLADWQPWSEPRPGTPGFWNAVPGYWAYRLPVFIAFGAFVVATAFWPKPKNLGHLLALSAAIFIGIQFWYADQGGVHVFWYLPLLLLLMFRPNLSDRYPPIIQPESDWIRLWGRRLGRFTLWVLHVPNPPVQVG